MGIDDRILAKIGPAPDWAQILPPCAESSCVFLASLHCLLSINGGAAENWPRVGLEAFATGVPVVAENRWGWREMVEHGKTGLLANNAEEFVEYTNQLAENDDYRLELSSTARKRLLTYIAEESRIWHRWNQLFKQVEARPLP